MVLAILYKLQNNADYSKLYEKIKSYGSWMHYIDSDWIISVTQQTKAEDIFAGLQPYINSQKDYILVIEVKNNYQGLLPKDAWDWMNGNNSWGQAPRPRTPQVKLPTPDGPIMLNEIQGGNYD